MMNSLIRLNYVIMCDDIREELSGKTTLVGVYGGNMTLGKIPGALPTLCFWINCSIGENFEQGIRFVLESPSKRRISAWHIPPPPEGTQFDPKIPLHISWKIAPVRFDEMGAYVVRMAIGDDEQPVYSFNVDEAPVRTNG